MAALRITNMWATKHFNNVFQSANPCCCTIYNGPLVNTIRNATKKAGGSVRRQNFNRKRKGRRYGPKVLEDQFVQPGAILMRQKGFKIHPGRNVDYGKDCTLFALREGFVKITQDVVERPEHLSYADGPFVERTFMHVLERPKLRRLVCLNPESLANIRLKTSD